MDITIFHVIAGITAYGFIAHYISYNLEKSRTLKARKWDLNICCGKTDGGGINADIAVHKMLPNFRLIKDIYNLPFATGQFNSVLCSHTLEHVDDPDRFFAELQRVGREVVIVIPPLYDIFAAINIFEHKTIFLTFRKKHSKLPPHINLPFSRKLHAKIGQLNHA